MIRFLLISGIVITLLSFLYCVLQGLSPGEILSNLWLAMQDCSSQLIIITSILLGSLINLIFEFLNKD